MPDKISVNYTAPQYTEPKHSTSTHIVSPLAKSRKSYLNLRFSDGGSTGSLSGFDKNINMKIVGHLPMFEALHSTSTVSKGFYRLCAAALRDRESCISMAKAMPAELRSVLAEQMRGRHDYESTPMRALQAAGADTAALEKLQETRASRPDWSRQDTLLEWCARRENPQATTKDLQLALAQPDIDVNAGENVSGEKSEKYPGFNDMRRRHPLEHLLIHYYSNDKKRLPKLTALLEHSQTNPNFISQTLAPVILGAVSSAARPPQDSDASAENERSDNFRILQQLIEDPRIKLDVTDEYGTTILHGAREYEGFSAISPMKLLLARPDARKLIDAQNVYGDTPLHVAVRCGDKVAVKLLLDHGANRLIKNKAGHTPYEAAKEMGRMSIQKIFIAHRGKNPAAASDQPPLQPDPAASSDKNKNFFGGFFPKKKK